MDRGGKGAGKAQVKVDTVEVYKRIARRSPRDAALFLIELQKAVGFPVDAATTVEVPSR